MGCEHVGVWDGVDTLRVILDDGHAEVMGDGMFVLFQTVDGVAQSVTVSADDLRRLLGLA